jgi:hypothetical protein
LFNHYVTLHIYRLLASAIEAKQSKDAGSSSSFSLQSPSSSHSTSTHLTPEQQQQHSHKLSQLLITVHLPSLIRLSLECPYGDIRSACKQLITRLSAIDDIYADVRPIMTGPSIYVPIEHTPSCYVDDRIRIEIPQDEEIDAGVDQDEGGIPEEQTQDTLQQQTDVMFEDLFLATGRVSHVEALMVS